MTLPIGLYVSAADLVDGLVGDIAQLRLTCLRSPIVSPVVVVFLGIVVVNRMMMMVLFTHDDPTTSVMSRVLFANDDRRNCPHNDYKNTAIVRAHNNNPEQELC